MRGDWPAKSNILAPAVRRGGHRPDTTAKVPVGRMADTGTLAIYRSTWSFHPLQTNRQCPALDALSSN